MSVRILILSSDIGNYNIVEYHCHSPSQYSFMLEGVCHTELELKLASLVGQGKRNENLYRYMYQQRWSFGFSLYLE